MSSTFLRLKNLITATAFTAAALFGSTAFAKQETLNVTWSGASFGNTAVATGFFTFDTDLIPNIGFQDPINMDQVIDLGITITGANSGNGTFTKSDFNSIYFASASTLDYSTQLIGQSLSNGETFGPTGSNTGDGEKGDFNLFGVTTAAPVGTWYFTLTTNNGSGDQMLVTSMTPAVPEPEAIALMLAGLVCVGFLGARRKSA